MDKSFVNNIHNYLESLEDGIYYKYFPSNSGLTNFGRNLKLGFSCYALKCFYITKKWDKLNNNKQNDWINFINSFQKNSTGLPNNSYVDLEFINNYQSFNIKNKTKNLIKKNLSFLNLYSYESEKKVLENNIRAETKQAISTLYQVGSKNKLLYKDFANNEKQIVEFLESFNWNKPWHAGAQFSALCVFTSTQLDNDLRSANSGTLIKFIDSKLNIDNGFYYDGNLPDSSELINGSMKVLTGLDWLGVSIHKPEKLIDFCLLHNPSSEGCDLVDVVYVLYRCSLETNYRRSDIGKYLESIKDIIFSHYKEREFGFSYYLNSSQNNYYGLKISNSENVADLHGTLLLLWAFSMIYDFENSENDLFNIIKP